MNEKRELDSPAEEFHKRLQEMLQKANISFVLSPPPGARREAAGRDPAGGQPPEAPDGNAEALRRIRQFNLKPRDISAYLDRFVVKQSEAKKALAVAICDHYNHVRRCIEDPAFAERDYQKHNMVLLGPSGVGKTYLIRCVAKLIGVPFVKADATKFSETGYVGHDVEDLVRDLVRSAGSDTELAKYGIIYIDEIDKIASAPAAGGRDVSGRGVQTNLLKLMEETEVNLLSQTDLLGQVQAVMDLQRGKTQQRTTNTRHILFIVSGAFDRLPELVKERVDSAKIGFKQDGHGGKHEADYLKLAQTRDFIRFGFEPEFIGRLPIRIVCERLTASDLEQILVKSEGSILRQYEADFAGYGIALSVAPAALTEIAARAEKENTGARGLMTVMERLLRDFKFELPSTSVKTLDIGADAIADPAKALSSLLELEGVPEERALKGDLDDFSRRFEREAGFRLVFTGKAADAIATLSRESGKPVGVVCEERFRDLRYGLTLAAKKTGMTSFRVTKNLVENPNRELSRIIARSFGKTA